MLEYTLEKCPLRLPLWKMTHGQAPCPLEGHLDKMW